jgi:hypothetical protein
MQRQFAERDGETRHASPGRLEVSLSSEHDVVMIHGCCSSLAYAAQASKSVSGQQADCCELVR